jgi:putative membrane protein
MRQSLIVSAMLVGGGLCLLAQVPSPQPSMGQTGRTNPATSPQTQPTANPTQMQTSMKADDKKFVRDAAIGGMTEVELGKLAAEKGSSDGVKQFGQKMVDDHTKANDELKKVAGAQSLSVPDSIDSKHRSRIDKLAKLSGAEFDRAYIKDQLKDHQQDVREFQDEAQNGNIPAVKDFAAKTLPTLQEHLTMVKDLNNGKSASNSADRSK